MKRRELLTWTLTLLGGSAVADDEPKPPAGGFTVPPKRADGDAPLPMGFPDATKPGVIEIKSYPAYRSAVAKGNDLTLGGDDQLFMPLFRHITQKNVEMTAPVISTYKTPGLVEKVGKRGEVTMEFLYQEADQGETGPGVGIVEVKDHQAGTYLCLGIQGRMDDQRMRQGTAQLRKWLDEHATEWTESGPPRRLGYHGPMTLPFRRLWEIQLPVKAVEPKN
jgi:hypothetical protein